MPPRDNTGLLLAMLQSRPRYLGMDTHPMRPVRPAPPRPVFEKGRYIPPSITRIIHLVARNADVSPEAICGAGRITRLVNCRYAIAKLSMEFAPRLSALAVDSAMLRGEGSTLYYRSRHDDRCALFEDYQELYRRSRAELQAGE